MWTYHLFERTILTFCEGLDFAELLDSDNGTKDLASKQQGVVEALRARRADQRSRLDRLLSAIEEGDAPAALLERIREGEQRLLDYDKELQIEDRKLTELMLLRHDAESVKCSIIDLFHQFETKTGDELYALRAGVAAQLKRVVSQIEVFPGGYIMSKEEWKEFTKDIPKRDIKRENLHLMMEPDKQRRFALIRGINGRTFPTYSLAEAEFEGMTVKADTLRNLGAKS